MSVNIVNISKFQSISVNMSEFYFGKVRGCLLLRKLRLISDHLYNPRTTLESALGVRRRHLKHLCCNPDACSGVVELLKGSYKIFVRTFVVVLF